MMRVKYKLKKNIFKRRINFSFTPKDDYYILIVLTTRRDTRVDN